MEKSTLIFENDKFIVAIKSAGVNFHSEEEAGFVVQVSKQLGTLPLPRPPPR